MCTAVVYVSANQITMQKVLALLILMTYRAATAQAHRDKCDSCATVTGMDFDLQPTLIGELVQLRPLRPDDFELFTRRPAIRLSGRFIPSRPATSARFSRGSSTVASRRAVPSS